MVRVGDATTPTPIAGFASCCRRLPSSLVVADLGCGEAKIARTVPNTVHSFDLHAANELITACDIAHTPLPDSSVNVAVFCLSLMGTNYMDFVVVRRRAARCGFVASSVVTLTPVVALVLSPGSLSHPSKGRAHDHR